MKLSFRTIFSIFITICFCSTTNALSCANYTFSSNQIYNSCEDLPHLGSSLHWNYSATTNTINMAYRAPQASTGWIAWGINPSGPATMVGSQAIVAFQHTNGSMVAYTTQLQSYMPSMAAEELIFPVSDVSAEFVQTEMVIYATVGLVGNTTRVDHVWQEGSSVSNDVPRVHSVTGDNIHSFGTIDFN